MSMSVQFGRWNLNGGTVDPDYLDLVDADLLRYGPDGRTSHDTVSLSIRYYAFHTTKESHGEGQPYVCPCGAIMTWDGRLDNRADLIGALGDPLTVNSTDVAIVARAYEKWGLNCFAKLIGDWALSTWNPIEHSVLLAKDPIGTHPLYYFFDRNQITWSTVLDPLVRLARRTFDLNEEYIAGWLSMFPAAPLTPYLDVHSVPPSSFVLLGPGRHGIRKYWDFDPNTAIRYRADGEYEEHFRMVFATAVRRRLRSDRPVLAELSGGRDSSSIVCVADEIIAGGEAACPRLDTISYYDDSEPNWNERPYFSKVEEKRGRPGWHINVVENRAQSGELPSNGFLLLPGYDGRTSPGLKTCMSSEGNRVVLSGIGGDEVMGGVPTPAPEFENYLAHLDFSDLARHLKLWALEKKRPWVLLFWEALRAFLPPRLIGIPKHLQPAAWLRSDFVKRHWAAMSGYPSRVKFLGPRPSFQENTFTLDALRRQLSWVSQPFAPPFEKRYPYLDRELLEFLFAIPREQLVRPRQRRSLMRRALISTVPEEILNRKAKAFVARRPLIHIATNLPKLQEMAGEMLSSSLGIVDQKAFSKVLAEAGRGEDVPIIPLMRTINLEVWLRSLSAFAMMDVRKVEGAWQQRSTSKARTCGVG
jgi:asparagine synthase (glutamine-hydrolysing)